MATTSPTQVIAGFEGFRPNAYYDRNAWRVGYGSDTVTNPDGTVSRVTPTTTTTQDLAQANLQQRTAQSQQSVINSIGQTAWDNLSPEAQAAATSVAYNYGSLTHLPTLVRALQSGDPATISQAIAARGVDNGGINAGRRTAEAALVAGHPIPPGDIPDATAYANTSPNAALSAINGVAPPLPRERPTMGPSPAAPYSPNDLYNQHWQPIPLAPLPSAGISAASTVPNWANAGDSLAADPVPLNSNADMYPQSDALINPATGQMEPTNTPNSRAVFLPQPNSSGPPDERGIAAAAALPNNYGAPGYSGMTQSANMGLPTRPVTTIALDANGNPVASPTLNADGSAYGLPASGPQAGGVAAVPPPNPFAGAQGIAALGGSAPVPMPANDRPAAQAPTNSKGYVIGQTYTMADGATFQANADGSFTKTASTPRAPTAIQTLLEAAKPGVMGTIGSTVNTAQQLGTSTADTAKDIGSSVAASGIGNLFSGLFNHPATPTATANTTPSSNGNGYIANTGDPTVDANLNDLNAYLNPSHTSNYGAPGYSGMDATYSAPSAFSGSSASGGGTATPPVDLSVYNALPAPASAAPTYVKQLNPAYTAWLATQQSGGSYSPAGSNYGAPGYSTGDASLQGTNNYGAPGYSGFDAFTPVPAPAIANTTPAPAKFISVKAPAVAAPPPVVQAAPPVVQQPTTLVQQLQATGLSPSEAYNVANGNPASPTNPMYDPYASSHHSGNPGGSSLSSSG